MAEQLKKETREKKIPEERTRDQKTDLERMARETVFSWARQGYRDLIQNYWNEEQGFFQDPYKDFGRSTLTDLMWCYGQLIFSLETWHLAAEDPEPVSYIRREMETYYRHFSEDWLLNVGTDCNPALDDAAWSCMTYMTAWRLLQDERALDLCHRLMIRTLRYWEDRDPGNGLFYRFRDKDNPEGHDLNLKSLYGAGILLSGLDYYEAVKGTKREDPVLMDQMLAYYRWMESRLKREDGLYWCSLEKDPVTGAESPKTGEIRQAGSCSALFGNTAMAVIHRKLYDLTKDPVYRSRAVFTANAIADSAYNVNGSLMNDRDAWTNCAFIGRFSREVLTLPGISQTLLRMIPATASSIQRNVHFTGGYYGADWQGGEKWYRNGRFGIPQYLTTSATTVHMLFAACQVLKDGNLRLTEEDRPQFSGEFPVREFPKDAETQTPR